MLHEQMAPLGSWALLFSVRGLQETICSGPGPWQMREIEDLHTKVLSMWISPSPPPEWPARQEWVYWWSRKHLISRVLFTPPALLRQDLHLSQCRIAAENVFICAREHVHLAERSPPRGGHAAVPSPRPQCLGRAHTWTGVIFKPPVQDSNCSRPGQCHNLLPPGGLRANVSRPGISRSGVMLGNIRRGPCEGLP